MNRGFWKSEKRIIFLLWNFCCIRVRRLLARYSSTKYIHYNNNNRNIIMVEQIEPTIAQTNELRKLFHAKLDKDGLPESCKGMINSCMLILTEYWQSIPIHILISIITQHKFIDKIILWTLNINFDITHNRCSWTTTGI